MKFTGHERDLGYAYSAADDLDYMHARHYNPQVGRFLSIDPVGGVASEPQTWNRYSHVLGNPLKYIDPEGLAAIDFCSNSGSDEEQAGSCVGTIEVIGEEPGDGPGFDSMTGVQGLADLVAGGGLLRNASSFNNFPHLPASMHGMTFRQGLDLATASGAGGDCSSDPNCILLAEAATALDNPLLRSIQGSQEFGLFFVGGSGSTTVRFLRYPNAGGGGMSVARGGRGFRLDWHRFRIGGKKTGRDVSRPHIDIPGKGVKHWPWHQVDKWKGGVR